MALDPNDSRPPYQQIADALRKAIQSGEYAAGSQLPSMIELRERYGVAGGTIQAALRDLRDEGLVVSWQGRGTFVRDQQTVADEPDPFSTIMTRLESMHDEIRKLDARLGQLERQTPDVEPERRPAD